MDSVELIKQICKENGISIAKLERECGFSNGYIRGLREGKMPADRLQKVAQFLGLPMEYLLTGEKTEGYYLNPETAQIAQEIFDNKGLKTLFDAVRGASPQELEAIKNLYLAMRRPEYDDPA